MLSPQNTSPTCTPYNPPTKLSCLAILQPNGHGPSACNSIISRFHIIGYPGAILPFALDGEQAFNHLIKAWYHMLR